MDDMKDPRWQQMRLRVMERDGWRCVACGATDTTLNVHHIAYGEHLWTVALTDLQTLCQRCHGQLGKHPKGGVYYQWFEYDDFGTCLFVVFRHCPVCGQTKTDCHSGCVIFDCDCSRAGCDMPEWCSDAFVMQMGAPDGGEAYVFQLPNVSHERRRDKPED